MGSQGHAGARPARIPLAAQYRPPAGPGFASRLVQPSLTRPDEGDLRFISIYCNPNSSRTVLRDSTRGSLYGKSQAVSSYSDRSEGSAISRAPECPSAASGAATKKARAARANPRRKFLLREADAEPDSRRGNVDGRRSSSRQRRMVRPRLHQANAI